MQKPVRLEQVLDRCSGIRPPTSANDRGPANRLVTGGAGGKLRVRAAPAFCIGLRERMTGEGRYRSAQGGRRRGIRP